MWFSLLIAATAAAEKPAVRIVAQQVIVIQPRRGRFLSYCNDVRREGCHGGFATVNALVREEARGAQETLKLWGFDDGKITLFHPDRYVINSMVLDRLKPDVGIVATPTLLTQHGLLPAVMTWLEANKWPMVWSNGVWSNNPGDAEMLQYMAELHRVEIIETPSGIKVGIIVIMGTMTFVPVQDPHVVTKQLSELLRRRGADVVL
eukprot:Hpha_TRINITY_DN23360_c0_g1::TRINITY_DN23360_c0_g1_i1::g.96886::m.96886